jgi:hypothetical protein
VKIKATIAALLAACAVLAGGSITAPAEATVVLPPGVTQTGPHSFVAQPAVCGCWAAIDGNTFSGIPYSTAQISMLRSWGVPISSSAPYLYASTGEPDGLVDAISAQGGWSPGDPVLSISGTLEITGSVPPDDDPPADEGEPPE